jgi:hypothetical protein
MPFFAFGAAISGPDREKDGNERGESHNSLTGEHGRARTLSGYEFAI